MNSKAPVLIGKTAKAGKAVLAAPTAPAINTARTAQDNALALAIQEGVPFVPAPFAAIAENLGISEEEVLERLRSWHAEKKLREISAVIEGSAVGYQSALVAGKVPPHKLEQAVAAVNAHPTVTHNYLRDHDYNLWFTLAVPPEMGLEPTLAILSREAGVPRFHPMQRTKTFKIGVRFDLETRENRSSIKLNAPVGTVLLNPDEKKLVRALQSPLPLEPAAFEAHAKAHGVRLEKLLAFGNLHLGGLIRRYVGTMRHRKLGVNSNGMVVWKVEEADQQRVGDLLAAAPEVSHCYAREPLPGFPYSVYSMVHAPDEETCLRVAARLCKETGIADYRPLFSVQEFKKARLRYFLPELTQWWNDHHHKQKGAKPRMDSSPETGLDALPTA